MNLQGLVILVHMSFLQLNDRICDLTVAMIDKTSSGFNLCDHEDSLPATLILYRSIRMKTYWNAK